MPGPVRLFSRSAVGRQSARNKNPGLGVSTETRAGCSTQVRTIGGEDRRSGWARKAGERITHPLLYGAWHGVCGAGFASGWNSDIDLELCCRNGRATSLTAAAGFFVLLLLLLAKVSDHHLHLIGRHAFIRIGVGSFLCLSAVSDCVCQIGVRSVLCFIRDQARSFSRGLAG